MAQRSHFADGQASLFGGDETPVPPGAPAPSYLRDHRARLRQRFREGGADALPDYEMLELLLFRAIPRRDVKPLARLLLDTFGDFNAVVSAPERRLAAVAGVGESVITELKLVEAAAHRLARSRVLQRPVVSSWDALLSYCQTTMAHRETEQFRIAAEALGITLHDHLVIGRSRELSFRAEGLL